MSLRLHDTRTREIRAFQPLHAGKASIYLCGPTVQAKPHIGHMRSAVNYDILRRWLLHLGYEVTFARNVTDIDDKIINVAAEQGVEWFVIAEANTRAFNAAHDALNVLPPTVEPRATGHMGQMHEIIQTLIDKGHAYPVDGDVYFNVRSWARYGEISGQSPDNLQSNPDSGPKRDALDFALWKGAKPGEPQWDSPWGPGRPGWHIECSAMAKSYLGEEFDIHGGGIDLIFPHHENETAQSEAAGHGFARFWVHHALINIGAEKMSKSLGNSLLAEDLLKEHRPVVLRYALGAAHYRSRVDWTPATLAEADAAYSRIETFLRNAKPEGAVTAEISLPTEFVDAMNDDLNVPQALAVLHNTVREGNHKLAGKLSPVTEWKQVRAMLAVLGLLEDAGTAGGSDLTPVVDALVAVALDARKEARERKDYAAADAIRDSIAAAGVVVEDTADGARWRLGES